MTARICVSILPKNNLEALSLIEQAEKAQADLIEVRLDCLKISNNFSDLTASTKTPLIATSKLQNEKGYFSGNEVERQQTLLKAAKSGFEYVDVDLSSTENRETISKLKLLGVKPIISYHKFDGTLDLPEMQKILEEEISCGASVCKIVTTAKQIEDNLLTLNFISNVSHWVKIVCFCMGEQGKISRLLSPLFGAFFTYASLEQGSETAAGQMNINEMRTTYNSLGIK